VGIVCLLKEQCNKHDISAYMTEIHEIRHSWEAGENIDDVKITYNRTRIQNGKVSTYVETELKEKTNNKNNRNSNRTKALELLLFTDTSYRLFLVI
jgi:hypothetical protein